jgi:hypothetical protein
MYTTRAQIWVNHFYDGSPEPLTIWAPPRPSPDAELATWGPVDSLVDAQTGRTLSAGSLGIWTTTDWLPQGVRLTFSADGPHEDTVYFSGQMMYPADMRMVPCPDGSGVMCGGSSKLHEYIALWHVSWVN